MSGKYTFYIKAHTTGSLVESIHDFLIVTNAPGLVFSSAITLYGTANSFIIGRLIRTPVPAENLVQTHTVGNFSRFYATSGSWVGNTTFIPYGASNQV